MMIVSVKHSGTRFAKGLLKTPFNRHFGEKYMHEAEGHTTVMVLRKLDAVIKSWARRDRGLKGLYEALFELRAFKPDYYLPIDSEKRDDYLNKLNKGLKLNISTDWAVMNHREKSANNWEIDPTWAEMIHAEFDPFYRAYY